MKKVALVLIGIMFCGVAFASDFKLSSDGKTIERTVVTSITKAQLQKQLDFNQLQIARFTAKEKELQEQLDLLAKGE